METTKTLKKSKSKHWIDIDKWSGSNHYFLNIHIDKEGYKIRSIRIDQEKAIELSNLLNISISTINIDNNKQ